jgi:predicted nucleic acid-binding protein
VQRWIAEPPFWLEVRASSRVPDGALFKAGLGAGERESILLAQELNADELIIDELRGRREASRRHNTHWNCRATLFEEMPST